MATATVMMLAVGLVAAAPGGPAQAALGFEVQSLDGGGNNVANPNWGQVGTPYSRVAPARYADGHSALAAGPNSRFISNRVFNDVNQNVFSEDRVSQWGWTWGQFLDHTFGLAQGGGETANIPFNSSDPLESFTDTLGVVPFTRDAAAPGTGVNNPREAINTVNSYIDAAAVYGPSASRLEWLRSGPVDNNMSNNGANLLLPNNYLPRKTERGDPASAPAMATDGRLAANPNNAMVAGDVRANENLALTATQTIFAREHNRIVGLLPNTLTNEEKFQIARRVVIAEQQYITYNEFLPAMGVNLPAYTGYKSNVNTNLSTEFATVGYRAHSQIHGEFGFVTDTSRYTSAQLSSFQAQGLAVTVNGATVDISVPLNAAFFNPDLLPALQIGPFLQSLNESQYKNDEQIDNHLRSTLFQVPVPGNPGCIQGPDLTPCFTGVVDLGAIDIERGRDHGVPSYNQLRQAYGLPARTSFAAITGEATDAFPSDPLLTAGNENNDPNSLDVMSLTNIDGASVPLGSPDTAAMTVEKRRTPLAARLRATYNNNVNNVDAFVGMMAEPHLPGAEFGQLQMAIWARQFQALRDGDRFFYGTDPGLSGIQSQYGIDFHRTLSQIIGLNTDIPAAELHKNVFLVADDDLPATQCTVTYTRTNQWPSGFQDIMTVTNTGSAPLNGWNVRFVLPTGQQITTLWNGVSQQSGSNVTVTNASWNGSVAPGATVTDVGFNGTWDNATNAAPPRISLNNNRCSTG
jgi:hypothetical protein